MAEANLKGLSFVHLVEFVRQHHGESGLKRLLAALPPDVAHILETAAAPCWYPLSAFVTTERRLVELFYRGDPRGAVDVGREDLEIALNVVYKFAFKFLAPIFLIKRAAKVWGLYLDRGRLEILDERPGGATLRIHALDPIHDVYCHDLLGGFTASLTASGAHDVQIVHTKCVLRGDPYMEYDATWTTK